MKVDLNKKFKDFKGNETTEVIADSVKAAAFSESAKAKIEEAGGKAEVV